MYINNQNSKSNEIKKENNKEIKTCCKKITSKIKDIKLDMNIRMQLL